jgi:hypothetical protein
MAHPTHHACGYSAFAPGCDDPWCLTARLLEAEARNWPTATLQNHLDTALTQSIQR